MRLLQVVATATATATAPTFQPAAVAASPSATQAATPPPAPQVDAKPAHDIVAGAMARAASQSTIHPLDTMKVRMQAGSRGPKAVVVPNLSAQQQTQLQRQLMELKGLYKVCAHACTGGLVDWFCSPSLLCVFLLKARDLVPLASWLAQTRLFPALGGRRA